MDTAFPFHISIHSLERGYPAHRHDFLEFSYVIEGSGAESVNGVRHPMAPGTFTFVLPYQVHELFTDPGGKLVLFNCMFSMEVLMQSAQDAAEWLSGVLDDAEELSPFVQWPEKSLQSMRHLMEDILDEYRGNKLGRTLLLKAKLTEALIRFDRHRRERQSDFLPHPNKPWPERSRWPIIHYIHRNFHREDLMLSELAGRFSLSVSRISELIKETTGQTFVHFLNDLRIQHAASLLVSTNMSIIEIAHEVGYASYKTFTRIFREKKGLVPTEYRKKQRQHET
ncbi:helix-turn-helix transcriptional regulator [Paenibacillus athensensis]|nr:AraC family transcriptional regulator [Paenibacillus athensensis]MCD1261249.1 helix-turn-helix transcriptional regulator [Paenibacillus athensensis]